MALSDEIRKQIRNFSSTDQPGKMLSYLKKLLKNGTVSAEEILDYSTRYFFANKPRKPYIINAELINKLGVVVENLDDKKQNKLSVKFYKLAAERNSSWGNRNAAMVFLFGQGDTQASPIKALEYAKKAVELSQSSPSEKHEHKFILFQALKANKKFIKANNVLIEYFEHKSSQAASEKEAKEEIKDVIDCCKAIVDKFETDIGREESLGLDLMINRIKELQPLVDCKITTDNFKLIKQAAFFIQGKYYEQLGQKVEAWGAYCAVTNKLSSHYTNAIDARVKLLKDEIKIRALLLSQMTHLNINDTKKSKKKNEKENSIDLMLPQGIPIPIKFNSHWKAETKWFHSVNEAAIETEFNQRADQVKKLIAAKEEEIKIVKEVMKESEDDIFLQKKKILDEELIKLNSLRSALETKYLNYLPQTRQTDRRHATESIFFNPDRSKKIEEIVALTEQIIDHRYNCSEVDLEPIKLTGKSTRLYITAERLFQETIIALSGDKKPQLGIPIARTEPWTGEYRQYGGSNNYGPIENFQVGSTNIKTEHRENPKLNRLGDSFVCDQGAYSDNIYPFLLKITSKDKEKEKQLTKYFIRYGKKHQPITLEELKTINEDANENDVDHFNQICFLIMEKEQAQWHSAVTENFKLGMSVAQARCLIMMEAGFINFHEAFKKNVLLGIYSHTKIADNPSGAAKSCEYIDKLYKDFLKTTHQQEHMAFIKKHIRCEPLPTCVLTKQQARQDMQEVYGGDSDTDTETEEYDSDLDNDVTKRFSL